MKHFGIQPISVDEWQSRISKKNKFSLFFLTRQFYLKTNLRLILITKSIYHLHWLLCDIYFLKSTKIQQNIIS